MTGDIRICVLQRGWVFVGEFHQDGSKCWLTNGQNIRRWGTEKGLGELAEFGPTRETKLDPVPELQFHELTLVCTLKCNAEKWSK